jgi:hypothetical protein
VIVELPFATTLHCKVRESRVVYNAGRWGRKMELAEQIIQGAGATGQLLADFRALAEATTPDGVPRHAPRPTLNRLARFLIGRAGGPNRDAPLYELCHLVNAVDACGDDPDRQALFFLHGDRASPATFRHHFTNRVTSQGWRRDGFALSNEGVVVCYRDSEFTITTGRMPFLVALYEFLCGMEDYAFYSEFNDILDAMIPNAGNAQAIQEASNAIARQVRQYRGRHLSFTSQNERFDKIYRFLRERAPEERLRVDDESVLDFWVRHSGGDDFKGYKTVFNAFANFIQALDDVARTTAAEGARSIGGDWEDGEIDPGDGGLDLGSFGDWKTPFAILDEAPAAEIKFFKKRGERDAIETLMEFGPRAVSLPLAFMRLESFGPVQAAITTDLQVKRGADSVKRRISCQDCEPYETRRAEFNRVLTHVRELQKAAFHALNSAKAQGAGGDTASDVVALHPCGPETLFEAALRNGDELDIDDDAVKQITEDAARSFRQLTRKGFDDDVLGDENRMEGFRVGAGAILSIAAQLEAFIDAMARLDQSEPGLASWHETDRTAFSRQFKELYGDAS